MLPKRESELKIMLVDYCTGGSHENETRQPTTGKGVGVVPYAVVHTISTTGQMSTKKLANPLAR